MLVVGLSIAALATASRDAQARAAAEQTSQLTGDSPATDGTSAPTANKEQEASDSSAKAEATAAVRRAQAAFQAGNYRAAIVDFTRANALRPAAKLEYNIGICHLRLHQEALEKDDREAEKHHADAAINAFNRYPKARPTSEDRAAVEDMIRSLGGTPITSAALRPAPTKKTDPTEPNPAPSEAPTPDQSDPTSEPEKGQAPPVDETQETQETQNNDEAVARARRTLPRGSIAAAFGLWFQPQLSGHATVEATPMALLSLSGGVYLGAKRRLFTGAGIGIAGGGNEDSKTKIGASALALDGLVGLHLPLGNNDRFVLPITAIIGATREALKIRNDMSKPTCSIGQGTQVGAHWGGRLGARLGALVLLGPRRAHGLLFDLDLSATIYGRGPLADGCEQSPFEFLALPSVRATIGASLGYTFRW